MMAGTPAGTVAGDRALPPTAWELWWLPGRRLSNGEVMPDRAALIEAQIPGLRRFACALQVQTFSNRRLEVSPDGTIELSAEDAAPLIRVGWTKLAEGTVNLAAVD
jgi:hypothetical protein